MTYQTNNPVGSVDVRDLYDNAEAFDNFSAGPLDAYPDRFGVSRQSLQGIRNASQYVDLGPYAAGLVFTSRNQVFSYNPGTGAEFYATGPSITLPYTTTGAGAGERANFRNIGDALLRSDLAATDGATRVGYGAETVAEKLDNLTYGQGREQMFTNPSMFSGFNVGTSVLLLGDSNSEGFGSGAGFAGGLAGRTIRSIMNANDNGIDQDRGYMYESNLQLDSYLTPSYGFSGNGSFITGGPVDSRFQLDVGEYLELTGREIAQGQLWYDPALSSGDFTVTVDGVTATTHTVGAGGTTGSFALATGGEYISPASIVRVTSTTGTKVITTVQFVRKAGAIAPLVYAAPKGGRGFSDFSAPAVVSELAAIVNSSSPTNRKLCMVLLGTNNMVAAVGKQRTPAGYISELNDLVVAYRAALGGDEVCSFLLWVPPKPQIALPLGDYQEYVDAIVSYCAADPRIACVRMDKTVLDNVAFYAAGDPLHLNEVGHTIAAHTLCRALGVTVNSHYPYFVGLRYTTGLKRSLVSATPPWTNSITARVDLTGRILMSGKFEKPGGAAPTVMGTLPVQFRPVGVNKIVTVTDHNGTPKGMIIGTNGDMTIIGDPVSILAVFVDGVSYDL